MAIVVIGASFIDLKGFPENTYLPKGRNAGRVEIVHGGVARNVVEDIANVELTPTFISLVDDTDMGMAVRRKLDNHKVNTDYVLSTPDGMGMWLAVFDENGDVAGSISKRPDMMPLLSLLEEKGDEIFQNADSIAIEVDIDKPILKLVLKYAAKYGKPVYAVVSNMSIASERRDLLRQIACTVCNEQEAEILFAKDLAHLSPEELQALLPDLIKNAALPAIVVTMGAQGAVFASQKGESGRCPAKPVNVADTTGAGDAFFAGVAIGLTYGKTLAEAVQIGTSLASSVIISSDNVCPRFLPSEFGIEIN